MSERGLCTFLISIPLTRGNPVVGSTPTILHDTLMPHFLLCRYLHELPEPICCRGIIFGFTAVAPFSFHHGVGWLVRHMPRDGLSLWEPIERRRCLETGWGEDMHAGESYPGSGLSEEITPLVLLCGVSA